jgi:hypothetical protein
MEILWFIKKLFGAKFVCKNCNFFNRNGLLDQGTKITKLQPATKMEAKASLGTLANRT